MDGHYLPRNLLLTVRCPRNPAGPLSVFLLYVLIINTHFLHIIDSRSPVCAVLPWSGLYGPGTAFSKIHTITNVVTHLLSWMWIASSTIWDILGATAPPLVCGGPLLRVIWSGWCHQISWPLCSSWWRFVDLNKVCSLSRSFSKLLAAWIKSSIVSGLASLRRDLRRGYIKFSIVLTRMPSS